MVVLQASGPLTRGEVRLSRWIVLAAALVLLGATQTWAARAHDHELHEDEDGHAATTVDSSGVTLTTSVLEV